DDIRQSLTAMSNYPKMGCPQKHGNNYFYSKNSGLQNQDVLFVRRGSLDADEEVLLDPNELNKDGLVSIMNPVFSDDGKWLSYGLSEGGSDWFTGKVRDTTTGLDLPDELAKLRFTSIKWSPDSRGFYYGVST